MTNCLFYSIFFMLFLNLSFGSLRISQVNRVFVSIYKGMLEASLLTVNNQGEPVLPYFDKDVVEDYVEKYLEKNISRYTKNYTLSLSYPNNDSTSTCSLYCSKLSINLKAKINLFYNYDKTISYKVRGQDEV